MTGRHVLLPSGARWAEVPAAEALDATTRAFTTALKALAALPSQSREALVEALAACCDKLAAAGAHHERFDADPAEALALASDATAALGALVRHLRATAAPATGRPDSAVAAEAPPRALGGEGSAVTPPAGPAREPDEASESEGRGEPARTAPTGMEREEGAGDADSPAVDGEAVAAEGGPRAVPAAETGGSAPGQAPGPADTQRGGAGAAANSRRPAGGLRGAGEPNADVRAAAGTPGGGRSGAVAGAGTPAGARAASGRGAGPGGGTDAAGGSGPGVVAGSGATPGAGSGSEAAAGSGPGADAVSGAGKGSGSGAGAGGGGAGTAVPGAGGRARTLDEALTPVLAALHAELGKDQDARLWLGAGEAVAVLRTGRAGPVPTTAGQFWRAAHMRLLQLPDAQRAAWRSRLSEAARSTAGGWDPSLALADGAGAADDPDLLVPAVPGISAAIRLAVWPDPTGPLPDITEPVRRALPEELPAEERHERWRTWTVRAAQVLRLVEWDPALVLYWMDATRGPIDPGYFEQTLVDTLRVLVAAGPHEPPEVRFQAELTLDALIGSVVRPVLPAADSWWWRWRAAPWPDLAGAARTAGYEVALRPSTLDREQVLLYTGENNIKGVRGHKRPLVQWVFSALVRRADADPPGGRGLGRAVLRPSDSTPLRS